MVLKYHIHIQVLIICDFESVKSVYDTWDEGTFYSWDQEITLFEIIKKKIGDAYLEFMILLIRKTTT